MFPSCEKEFTSLTQKADIIPVYEEYSAALETPLSIFLKINTEGKGFLLESVEKGLQVGRYSFIGADSSLIFQSKGKKVSIIEKGIVKEINASNPLEELEKIMQSYKPLVVPDLPCFSGGAVGYIGYNMVRHWEDMPVQNESNDFPDSFFVFADTMIIFDHVKQTMKIVVNVKHAKNKEAYFQAQMQIKEIYSLLQKKTAEFPQEKKYVTAKNCWSLNYTQQEFEKMVLQAKEYILAGDIFQVVLSGKIKFELNIHPLLIYRTLRHLNPSPYMFYFSFLDICLIGSSPEVMVKVEDRKVELRPIAGTRPRGKNEEEEELLNKELLADEKERAEHLMLVDLGRNDLGRVCEYGSVDVEDFMFIENYSHVKHIVSRVIGSLCKEYSCFDVLKAVFPAGTVSGAPKIRAMEIIDELENEDRGPYAGAVGYISYQGNMDTCIAIRTIFCKGEAAYIQAGAGIVADSNPEKEYQEILNKAQALLQAVKNAEEVS